MEPTHIGSYENNGLCRSLVFWGWLMVLSGLTAQPSFAAPASEVLARVHWLGLKQVSADTNSAHFLEVWRLPQTTALVAQTLDKFSRWPGGGATNAAGALLRPLLDDLVASESCWELRAPTNLPSSALHPRILLAIRLPADRARLWQTNLAAAVEDLTGARPVPAKSGWLLRQTKAPQQIEFSRTGEWTLVAWGPDAGNSLPNSAGKAGGASVPASRQPPDGGASRADISDSLSKFADRIIRNRESLSNDWLAADLDPSYLIPCLATLNPQLSTLNQFHLTLTGQDGHVLTRGTFDFSRPLDLPLSPWEIPTNLIRGPLTDFTAVRGLAPWLAAMPGWQKLGLTPPPGQLYYWAQEGTPFQTFFAAPLPAASNQIWRLAGRLVQNANPWLATHGEGYFQWNTNPPALVWSRALLFFPFLKPVSVNQHDYVLGGLTPPAEGNPNPPPAESLRVIRDTHGLVFYQSEHTGIRIEDYLFNTQLFRLVFHKPQLPTTAAATVWLKHVEPLMGDSTTEVTQTGAAQLTLTRNSTVGCTALELHLLADWLESPQFPRGLHTFLAPPDK